jgi:thioredoxin 1
MGVHTRDINDNSFEAEVLKSKKVVLVDFWAEWCGPCKALGPRLEEVAGELKDKVDILKLDVDSNKKFAAQYDVRGIPTLIVFKNGQEVDRIVGAVPKDTIVSTLSKHS